MDKKKFLAVSICVALFLSGCQTQTPVENEWSELWGNSSGNILGNGYVATDAETICYTDLNNTNDFLYKLNETGEPILLSNKLAYNINMINDRVYFVSGLPGSICSIRTDGTDFTTLVRGECYNLFVSQTHIAYLNKGNLEVSHLSGKNTEVVTSNVRKFIPFDSAFIFATSDGVYRINPDGTGLECLFDKPPISLCANNTSIYFSVSNDMNSFGKTGGKVYQIDNESTVNQLPIEYECWNLNATDNYLFFRNQSDKGALYRMDLDGRNAYCILDENCSDVNIIESSIVFRVITTGKSVKAGYYIIEQDGTNLRVFNGRAIRNF